MTKAEIFIQILSEIAGRPKEKIGDILKHFRKTHPGGKWDEEVPEEKAAQVLANLRKEAPGILALLGRGGRKGDNLKGNG